MSDFVRSVFTYFGVGCALFLIGLLVMQAVDKIRYSVVSRLRKKAEEAEDEARRCTDLADAQADQIEWLKYRIEKLEEQIRDQQGSDSDTDGAVPDGGNGRPDDDDQGGEKE